MKKSFDRSQRVGDLISRSLATMLLEDMTDERFRLVTVMSVAMSKDLSYAKVYVSVLLDDKVEAEKVVQALNRAAKSLRYQLAKEVKLRIMPELKFVYDETTAKGFHLSGIIDDAMKKTNKD